MGFLRIVGISIGLWMGCVPSRHTYLGFQCDPSHPCPEPLLCTPGGICAETLLTDGGPQDAGADAGLPDAGPRRNLVTNPSFEDSFPITYWQGDGPISYDTQFAHSGTTSLRLETSTSEVHNTFGAISLSGAGLYCIEAWVSGTGPAMVSFSYKDPLKGDVTGADRPEAHATLQKDKWVTVRTRLMVGQGFGPELSIALNGPGWVDDVSVWLSRGGDCREY